MVLLISSASIFFLTKSRSLSLIFLFFSVSLFFRREKWKGIMFLLVSIVAYCYAITFRGVDFVEYNHAYEQFFSRLDFENSIDGKVQFLLGQVINIDFASSISVALTVFETFKLDVFDYFTYFLSLGPFPSSLLPEKVLFFGSLTRAAGLSVGVGINTDIMSEPYLMAGWPGVMIIWFLIGIIFSTLEATAVRFLSEQRFVAVLILCLPMVGFYMLGTVASIRSASRLFWWTFSILICANFFTFIRSRKWR
jgi:hypothetical protein